jgi:hypothetical protein
MVKFNEVVTVKRTSCHKCLTLMYSIPCKVDDNIPKYLKSFGEPLWSLKSIRLLRIDSKDGYKIESKIGKNAIKFAIPKTLENTDLASNLRKQEFEIALAQWMANKLDIPIVIGEQEIKNG